MKKQKTGETGTDRAEPTACGIPGQDLVMAGYMGLAGSATLVRLEKNRLRERLPEEILESVLSWQACLADKQEIMQPQELSAMGASAWLALGAGGIMNGLWEMAARWGVGFSLELKEVPFRQETIEVCELLGINPYYLYSEQCLLLAADNGGRLCRALRERGIPAAVAGVLTDTEDKILTHAETRSCLNRPRQDELERFLSERKEKEEQEI